MKKIIILSGDPNSINSEIIFKSWKQINNSIRKKIYLISNYKLLNEQFKRLKYSLKIERVKNINTISKKNNLKLIDINLNFRNPFKISKKTASRFVISSLDLAHREAQKKDVAGIINCAIDKKLLNKKQNGVTEYLAAKCGIKDNSHVMLIHNKKLAISPITTHLDLKNVSKKIKKSIIIKKIKTIDSWFRKKFKIKPNIGVLGLNPHNAELRKNSEENKIIIPAILNLKKQKIKINGPLAADSLFISDFKKYDVIIGMYHDQILTPFKTLFKFDAINITLGINYLRVSPDHGTAIDLVGKNIADPKSLVKCIKFLNNP